MARRRNTLLHFLVGTAEPEAKRLFTEILAVDLKSLKKIPKLLKKHQEEKKYWEGSPFELKDPLDLSPEEFEALTRVRRDPTEQVQFEIELSPENLSEPKFDGQIETLVNQFYHKNSLSFDSPNDLSFDRKTKTLFYSGPKKLVPELLSLIGIKKEARINKMSKRDENLLDLVVPVQDIRGISQDDIEAIEEGLNSFKSHRYGKYEPSLSEDDSSILFKGTRAELVLLIREIGGTSPNDILNNLTKYKRK